MRIPIPRIPLSLLWLLGAGIALVTGYSTFDRWWPATQQALQAVIASRRPKASRAEQEAPSQDEHAHEGHAHGHDDANSLELSPQALGNIGLGPEFLRPVKLETFQRTITVPALIVERPGRTRIEVSTPMAGVITHVHAVQGESVLAGTLLFDIRITAEELVETQTELLKTMGNLDVENREIERLKGATQSGAISQKTLLEKQYSKEKLEVLLSTQREALRLHGLSERQIDDIVQRRRLLRNLQIRAPDRDGHTAEEFDLSQNPIQRTAFHPPVTPDRKPRASDAPAGPLLLHEVRVHKGETVMAGATLAVVSDYSELYIEGRAFEQDADALATNAQQGWKVTALFEKPGNQTRTVKGLDLVYSANEIDVEARTLSFYVRLPNRILRESPSPNGQKFIEWQFKPGQRLQLQVPVEEWEQQIVLPVQAIAQEGAESYVFQQNGAHFERVPVRVLYRDQTQAVLASGGSIFPGDVIARRGAHQMQMALKNKSGGGADPHAGHNH